MTWPISAGRYAAGAPAATGLFSDIISQLSYISGIASTSTYIADCPVVPNGSFEVDAVTTVTPTGWTATPIGGGSGQVTNTHSSHGAQSYLAVQSSSSGAGGMALKLATPLPASWLSGYHLRMNLLASNSGTQTKVTVTYLSATLSTVTSLTFTYNNPTSWGSFDYDLTNQSVGICYIQVEIDLGITTSVPSSTTNIYLDNVTMVPNYPGQHSGLFSLSSSGGTSLVPGGCSVANIVLNSTQSGNEGYIEGIAYVNAGSTVSWSQSGTTITVSWSGPYGGGSISLTGGTPSAPGGWVTSESPSNSGASYLQIVY